MKTSNGTIEAVNLRPIGMSDEVASQLWSKLSDRIVSPDAIAPLTPEELRLYKVLTVLLTERAQLVAVSVIDHQHS